MSSASRTRLPRRSPDLRLDLTPLIDVVFLLLTFFVFSIVLMVRADALDVRLPELVEGENAPTGRAITVTVTEAGDIRVDTEPANIEDLAELTQARLDAAGTDRLLLAVDENAPSGTLIRVAGELARNGLGDFSVIGRPAETSPTPTESQPAPAGTPPPDAP